MGQIQFAEQFPSADSPGSGRRAVLFHPQNRVLRLMLKSCLLQFDLYFSGCRSLKEKRHRLKGLRDRLGKAVNVAVCESGHQNSHQRSQWSVIAAAADAVIVEKILADVERTVQFAVDGELIGVQREWLR